MSRLLRYLLEAEEPLFTQSIRELEYLTHKKGVDVRLTADILEKMHAAIRSLDLDSNDTTDKELYFALKHKVHDHNAHIMEVLGLPINASARAITEKLIEVVRTSEAPQRAWVLKRSVAKSLLRDMPPKNLMKHLRYRSIESMFKNEKFSEVYVALRFSEGDEWLQQFNQLLGNRVQPPDFENRKVDIIQLSHTKWADLAKKHFVTRLHPVAHTKELGILAILPTQDRTLSGLPLRVLPLLFHYLNEIRLYSAFFKLKSTEPAFGRVIGDTLSNDVGTGANVANFHIHWRVIQRHFGAFDDTPELFQPHVQPEDLLWQKAEESLSRVSNELRFWKDMDYVAMHGDDGLPISFNLADAAVNYSYDLPMPDRSVKHFRESLWNEIFMRYMGEETLKKQVLSQLDSTIVKPEEIL